MWLRLLSTRYDNPLFVQARRSLRRRWWRSWVGPSLAFIVLFYGFLITVQFGVGMGQVGSASTGLTTRAILRMLLMVLGPLIALASFASGARGVQRERERGTLESLLLTDLTNEDLITGKILGGLLPFVLLVAALVPAVAQFGDWSGGEIPAVLTKKWRFQSFIESLWYLPQWELLIYLFLAAVLGVVYGVHRAAHYRRPSMIYSFGMISFLVLIPFGILVVSHLFESMIEMLAGVVYYVATQKYLDFGSARPFARVLGGVGGAWLLTLIPMFDLEEKFRYLCGEEQDPRYLTLRPRSGSTPKPPPWTERPGPVSVQDIWAAEYEKQKERGPRPGQAIIPRTGKNRGRGIRE